MADILAPRVAFRPLSLPAQRLPGGATPKLAIGATIAAMFSAMGEAMKLACVSPYAGTARKPRKLPDEDLQGRDPDW